MQIENVLSRNFVRLSVNYKRFALEKSQCQQCSLFCNYKQVVQSEGNAESPTFMFVGEGPGKEEVVNQRPFIGCSGERLRTELRKYPKTFDRNSCIISNVLACRPLDNVFPREKGGPYWVTRNNEKKTVESRELVNFCATNWLRKEIALLKPKVIIILGAKALDYVRGDSGIGKNRGVWKFLPKYRAWSLATYHPTYILRCQNDPDKPYVVKQFVEDIEKITITWREIVNEDPNMTMSEEEWKRVYALKKSGFVESESAYGFPVNTIFS